MAEIAGATIDWNDYSAPTSPRILNIPEAAGDVTVQDLWDTLSAQAALLDNLIYKKTINRPEGGGKAVLSPVKSVGITLALNNIQIKFPDKPSAPYVIKRVQDGNVVAVDHLGAAMEPMANSDFTNWKLEADVSAAIITGQPTKGVALSDFVFTMVQSTDHVTPSTGLTVSAQRSLDGGAFAATDNSPLEIGNGYYSIDLTANDLNGKVVALRFTAVSADQREIVIVTAG